VINTLGKKKQEQEQTQKSSTRASSKY